MTWMQTLHGQPFDLVNPDPAMVDFHEVARALSRQPRFSGHTLGQYSYSVAQHEVVGAETVLRYTGSHRLAMLFLHHDDHEAYIGDISTPTAQALAYYAPEAKHAIRELKLRLDAAIWRALGILPPTSDECAEIKRWDRRMLLAERNLLMAATPRPWDDGGVAPAIVAVDDLEPWFSEVAEREWLWAFEQGYGK